jgi:tRNA(fMet)-specific endonuclease VapC
MSIRVMLDTNAVVALVKARSPALEDYVRGRVACISVVTEAEVLYGLARRPVGVALRRVIEGLLATVEILPWDSACAAAYGSLRAQLETLGKPLAPMDLLIAAHALATRCPLVTADRAFTQVSGLSVVEWSAGGVTVLTERPAGRARTKRTWKRVTPRDVHEAVVHAQTPVRKAKSKAR